MSGNIHGWLLCAAGGALAVSEPVAGILLVIAGISAIPRSPTPRSDGD